MSKKMTIEERRKAISRDVERILAIMAEATPNALESAPDDLIEETDGFLFIGALLKAVEMKAFMDKFGANPEEALKKMSDMADQSGKPKINPGDYN